MNPEDRILKRLCEDSLLFFACYIYKECEGTKFIPAKHLEIIADYLHQIFELKLTRVIFNIPPRYGKTELIVKIFMAWCIAKENSSKFIHLSYSDSLALDNSSKTKEYIQSDAFQRLWNMQLKKDAQSKSKWYTEYGGGVYATAAGGSVTGFGAGGTDENKFEGAIIIDDPLKPDDALSEVKRAAVNDRFDTTIQSRVNNRNTPIIVVMQRLHENDLTGKLLDTGSEWTHVKMPALDEDNQPLWDRKHTFKELQIMRERNPYVFANQYMQEAAPLEGGEWKRNWFGIVPNMHELPKGLSFECLIDGAYTKDTKNDPTGIEIWGYGDGNAYLISIVDKYMTLPELKKYLPNYFQSLPKYDDKPLRVNITLIEPKASGKSLVQVLRQEVKINASEISGNMVRMSKIERARTASPFIEGGRVWLLKGSWNENYINQVTTFPNAMHDEHVDLTSYACERYFMKATKIDFR